jgi:hypothetical protein
MPVSTLLQRAHHGTNSAALFPGRMHSGAFSALVWAKSRFGIDFLVVIFSIVVVAVVVVFIICAAYFFPSLPLFTSRQRQ